MSTSNICLIKDETTSQYYQWQKICPEFGHDVRIRMKCTGERRVGGKTHGREREKLDRVKVFECCPKGLDSNPNARVNPCFGPSSVSVVSSRHKETR